MATLKLGHRYVPRAIVGIRRYPKIHDATRVTAVDIIFQIPTGLLTPLMSVFDLLYPLDGTELIGDYWTAIDKGVCKGISFSRHFVAIVNSIYQEC